MLSAYATSIDMKIKLEDFKKVILIEDFQNFQGALKIKSKQKRLTIIRDQK